MHIDAFTHLAIICQKKTKHKIVLLWCVQSNDTVQTLSAAE